MAKFIVRRVLLMLLTMFMVALAVFLITEAAPGNVARNVLGVHITPEQEASFLAQSGLDKPVHVRFFNWLAGSDWHAERRVGLRLHQLTTEKGFREWWAVDADGTLVRWELQGDDLILHRRLPDGTVEKTPDNERWQVKEAAPEIERLTAVRAEVAENAQLADADREIIIAQLDRILAILNEEGPEREDLQVLLREPEASLQSLMDPMVPAAKDAFQKAQQALLKVDLFQILPIYDRLNDPSVERLQPGDFQSMARRLDKAAGQVEAADPSLAAQMGAVSQRLQAGEIDAAREMLPPVYEGLNRVVGGFVEFTMALGEGDYRGAAAGLRQLADTPFSLAQAALIEPLTDRTADEVEDATPELGAALALASESLEAGDVEAARGAFADAATRMEEIGRLIARYDVAREAQVTRVFWGVDTANHVVKWEKGGGEEVWSFAAGVGWQATSGGPVEFIPIQKGLIRGDPGISLRTGRPVSDLLFIRLRNSLVLAGIAFVIVMPLALFLGMLAGIKEGRLIDRVLSVGGMMFSVTPEFATGIFLILIFASWLKLVPGATVFGEQAPWTRPDMLVLPVATLTLIELGYVLRITRASMVEVMKAPYIRTAFLKGLPYWRVVTKHAVRNALMAPITIIMLHVNWLLGGIVVVEVIFGYPGLGSYLLDSALFKDFNAIEAGAMILVTIAVVTQLVADIIYTFLNPRIRYS